MDEELTRIVSQLATEGIRVDVRQPNSSKEVFVVELSDGTKYLFSGAGLLRLRDEGRLNIRGIEKSGVRK